ncbi:hypothetical protein [Methylobacterium sp. AMS5]|uniref:hypothetical protein n=1 Tax=Methylobacterium sp. AMS5 TaxID=925818 RepID=UPI000762D9E2|nr:hypothetical protein [Methylobacterium sp. AMS5]
MESFQPLPSVKGNNRVGLLDKNGTYVPSVRMCDLGRALADAVIGDEELGQAIAAETRNRVPGRHWALVKKNAVHPWGYYLHEDKADAMLGVVRDKAFIEQARKDLTRNKSIAKNRRLVREREEKTMTPTPTPSPIALPVYIPFDGMRLEGTDQPLKAITFRIGGTSAEQIAVELDGRFYVKAKGVYEIVRPELQHHMNAGRCLRNAGFSDTLSAWQPGRGGRAVMFVSAEADRLNEATAAFGHSIHLTDAELDRMRMEIRGVIALWRQTLPVPDLAPSPAPVITETPAVIEEPVEETVAVPKRTATELFDRVERMEEALGTALGRIDQFTTIFQQMISLVGENTKALNGYRDLLSSVAQEQQQGLRLIAGGRG